MAGIPIYKLIIWEKKNLPSEMYDLATDRAESNNLATSEPNRVREMAQIWTQHFDEFRKLASQDLPAAPP